MNWETYIAFGDSITIGARSYMGYPEYTGALLEKATKKSWNVMNHATSGYTTIDLARSMDTHMAHLRQSVPSICTLLIGTNDLKKGTSAQDFETAYNLLLIKIKLLGSNHIKLFEIPVFPTGVMYPYTVHMNDLVPVYNAIIQKLGSKHNIPVYPLTFSESDLYDGVHLNEQGSKNIAAYFSQLILKDRGL